MTQTREGFLQHCAEASSRGTVWITLGAHSCAWTSRLDGAYIGLGSGFLAIGLSRRDVAAAAWKVVPSLPDRDQTVDGTGISGRWQALARRSLDFQLGPGARKSRCT